MPRSALFLLTVMLATLSAVFTVQAQIVAPGACALAPSFCELRGKVLDAARCRCVRPIQALPGSCGLVPSFCELRGKVLDTERCRCVNRLAGAPACELVPFFCELNGQTLDTRRCKCVPSISGRLR